MRQRYVSQFRHPPDGYAFIVTYGRSGSTLLQRLMNAVPGCLIRGENNNALYPLFRSWWALAHSPDIRDMRARSLISDPAHPWFGAERIDADTYARMLTECFVAQVLRPPPGTRIGGFKEIRTLPDQAEFRAYLAFILRNFPRARLIFNTRDVHAVARSSWWRRHDPAEVQAVIHSAEQVFDAVAAAHPSRCLTLRYEEYVSDQNALEPLFQALDGRPAAADMRAIMRERLTHAT